MFSFRPGFYSFGEKSRTEVTTGIKQLLIEKSLDGSNPATLGHCRSVTKSLLCQQTNDAVLRPRCNRSNNIAFARRRYFGVNKTAC
jgi:hypothetical protein